MAITKEKKGNILAKLEAIKKDAKTLVFVKFKGVSVAETSAMRKALREAGVGYFVAKKSLMKRAFGDTYTGEMPTLDGEIAVAYSADQIAPAQNIKDWGKKYKEAIAIAGGVFEGAFKTKEEMTVIASIPGMEVLRGMFAQIINSPRARFAMVLNEVSKAKA